MANPPERMTLRTSRGSGCRPSSVMSEMKPMVLKRQKTPRKKRAADQRGICLQE
jgi:hypothetical protein